MSEWTCGQKWSDPGRLATACLPCVESSFQFAPFLTGLHTHRNNRTCSIPDAFLFPTSQAPGTERAPDPHSVRVAEECNF
jgi:hypothetical protein